MRLDIARAGAPLGLAPLGLSGIGSLLFPSHICTIHEEGPEGPVGPLAPLDASSDSTSRRSPAACGPRHGTLSSPTRRSADVIDLYSEAPVTGGRVLRFKVPFVHTTGGTFFRRLRRLWRLRRFPQKRLSPPVGIEPVTT